MYITNVTENSRKTRKGDKSMNRTIKLIAALLVAGIVFTGTNSLATIRHCHLDNAKSVVSTNSCTPKNSKYFVAVSHGSTSASNSVKVQLQEWKPTYQSYFDRTIHNAVAKGITESWYPSCGSGSWAKLKLIASGSKGSGRGSISNEF